VNVSASLALFGANELLRAYRARRLSPTEVARAGLDVIAARNPELNAFAVVDAERAMAAARGSEARWRAGTPCGALDGIPVTVKDLCDTIGMPSRSGSLTTSEVAATEDAPSVARLRQAGAIILGKTAMCEFGWKGVTDSPLLGISRNPCNPARTCGGSSGGAAIAAATGMGALHLGSDGAGSIRIPAAFCGVYGFKATFGRVPAYPPGRMALGHYGPLARTVEDAALMLEVIARPDVRDPLALPHEPIDYRASLAGGVDGWRVAYCPTLCGGRPDPDVQERVTDAVRVFESLGAHVDEIDSPIGDPRPRFDDMWAASMAQIYRKVPEHARGRLDPGFAAIARAGLGLDANALLDAVAARLRDGTTMGRFHERYDLLLTPQMPTTAFAAGVDHPPGMSSWLDWSPYTYAFNWTQQPAASIPCGTGRDGMPVALQIVGARFAEVRVLRASFAYEAARGTSVQPSRLHGPSGSLQ